jgi:hypothetical protein
MSHGILQSLVLPRPGGFPVGAEPVRRPGEYPPGGRVIEEREGAGGGGGA